MRTRIYQLLVLSLSLASVTLENAHSVREDDALEFSELLISKYASDGQMSKEEFLALYQSIRLAEPGNTGKGHGDVGDQVVKSEWCDKIQSNASCMGECVVTDEVFATYASESVINSTSLVLALPALLMAREKEECQSLGAVPDPGELIQRQRPSKKEVWGYGVGFVVLVCFISNLGAFMAPIINTSFFKKLLMFLVSVAVGTLAATGIIVLVPESMNLMAMEELRENNLYIWRTTTVLGGILFFYLSERLLKITFAVRKSKKAKVLQEVVVNVDEMKELAKLENNDEDDDDDVKHGHSHMSPPAINAPKQKGENKKEGKRPVQTLAWMMLLGDALHKIVDGLSVGAAFSQSVTTGLSLSIAILCEELPHELGDVAILLHSGMSMRKALFCNTLTAMAGFLGLVLGIFLGDVATASQWIFAVAGGIFLYVPLVDMLPEMSEAADKSIKDGASAVATTAIQIIGLLLGVGIILVVALFAGNIQI